VDALLLALPLELINELGSLGVSEFGVLAGLVNLEGLIVIDIFQGMLAGFVLDAGHRFALLLDYRQLGRPADLVRKKHLKHRLLEVGIVLLDVLDQLNGLLEVHDLLELLPDLGACDRGVILVLDEVQVVQVLQAGLSVVRHQMNLVRLLSKLKGLVENDYESFPELELLVEAKVELREVDEGQELVLLEVLPDVQALLDLLDEFLVLEDLLVSQVRVDPETDTVLQP